MGRLHREDRQGTIRARSVAMIPLRLIELASPLRPTIPWEIDSPAEERVKVFARYTKLVQWYSMPTERLPP